MSRVMALVAALVLVPTATNCLWAQNAPEGEDPFGANSPTPAASTDDNSTTERARRRFEAARTKGLLPKVVKKIDFDAILRQPTSFAFDHTSLGDVIDFLSTQHDIEIQIDEKGLTDAAVDPSAPVTRSVQKWVSLESGLRLILDEFDLAIAVENETLKITSKERADRILTTTVYPVNDLVTRPRGYAALANMILGTIRPDSWNDNGGPGSIFVFAKGGQLIVSQTRAAHAELRDLLAAMRSEIPPAESDKDDVAKMTTNVYQLWGTAGDQAAEAIKRTVAPSSWEGNGGEGIVCVVGQNKNAAALPGWDLLLVRQTEDVQAQIDDLLAEFNRAAPIGKGGGMMGGMMGGGHGGQAGAK